jgi:tRNA modification GTPase
VAEDTAGATIAALATAPGHAGVAVVRVSGTEALAVGRSLSQRPQLPHGQMRYGPLRHEGALIDHGYVVAFHAPRSFTGEDCVEFHVHGSPAVVDRLLEVLAHLGARPARAGEFTLRAYAHGRLDLVQAEALADLISARSEFARQAALAHLDGALSRQLEALRQPVLTLLAEVEARLDFADEAGQLDRRRASDRLDELCERLARLRGTAQAARLRLHGARVVLYGPPNAGKSSLFNALVGVERALVDARPGTTRDTIELSSQPDGVALTWVDTAGVRDTDDRVERAGTERARAEVLHADVVLWLDDGSGSTVPAPEGAAVVLRVRSKVDLGPVADSLSEWRVSAATGEGVDALRQAVVAAVRNLTSAGPEQAAVARTRHVQGLTIAEEALRRAQAALSGPLELVADDLRDAVHALDELTGAVTADDVLGAIFSQFCIGK